MKAYSIFMFDYDLFMDMYGYCSKYLATFKNIVVKLRCDVLCLFAYHINHNQALRCYAYVHMNPQ